MLIITYVYRETYTKKISVAYVSLRTFDKRVGCMKNLSVKNSIKCTLKQSNCTQKKTTISNKSQSIMLVRSYSEPLNKGYVGISSEVESVRISTIGK